MLRWPGLPLRSRVRALADLYRGLTKDVGDASMVLYGTLSNAKPDGDGGGTTDFAIEEVVKEHAIRGDKKSIRNSTGPIL